MKVVDFSTEEIRDIFKLLSGTLHLGNVEFMTAGGAQVTTKAGKWDPSNLVDHAKPHKAPNNSHSIILSPSAVLVCSAFASRFPAVLPSKSTATGCMAPEHWYGLVGLWPCDPFCSPGYSQAESTVSQFLFCVERAVGNRNREESEIKVVCYRLSHIFL